MIINATLVNKFLIPLAMDVVKNVSVKSIENSMKNKEKEGKLLDNLISLSEVSKEYLRQEIELRRKEIEQGKMLTEAIYNQGNRWPSLFTPEEIKDIFRDRKEHCRLLMLAAEPDISNLPDGFGKDLKLRLRNRLTRFMEKYYPQQNEQCSVQFYGQFFQRPVFDADLTKLERVLAPVPTVVLYTDITSQEVFFNVRLIGKVVSPDKVLTLACEPWHWRADMGGSSERILEQVGEVIIQVHQILVAFLADCYFLGINPHHEPRCLTTEVQKELSLLDSNKSLVAELRNARENLLNYLKELAIKEQIKYHLYEFARNAKNKIPTFYEYKVTSRHMFGYGYFALSTVLNRREKNRSIENFLNSDHGKGELPSEVNRRKMLIEEFWNSELPNIWSTMRNSVSNSEVKAKLPHPLPLCKVKVTVVTRADCGSDSIPNNRPGRPLIGPGSELFLEVTLLNTYYRVKAEPDIAQAIDEAVANVLKGVDTVSSEKGLRFGRLFFDGGKLGLK